MWNDIGHNGVDNYYSQRLTTPADRSASTANPACAASTLRLEALMEEIR